MYVLLVCVWCSLDAGGLLMVVTAQPTVSAEILTPEADRKEGGQVDMRCVATNLQPEHIVEWSADDQTLRWADTTVAINHRFRFTSTTDPGITIQYLSITDLQVEDMNEYACNVRDLSLNTGIPNIVATSVVLLTLELRFSTSEPQNSPSNIYPPSSCSQLAFQVSLILFLAFVIVTVVLTLTVIKLIKFNNRLLKHLALARTETPKADPYMELQPTEDKNKVYMEPTTATTTTQDTYYQPVEVETDSPEYDYARPDDPKEQRRDHQASVHVDPTPSSEATGTQHTYYQPETDSHEYDYARPEGSTNTDYEAVSKPQSSAEGQYQNT